MGGNAGKRAIELGATSVTVAENLLRVRRCRGLSVRALSAAMAKAGRSVSADAISRMETGQRRIDVDDVVAFAVVLGVSPLALLMPMTHSPTDMIEVTGAGAVAAADAWSWAGGQSPLDHGDTGRAAYEAAITFKLYGMPHWLAGGES